MTSLPVKAWGNPYDVKKRCTISIKFDKETQKMHLEKMKVSGQNVLPQPKEILRWEKSNFKVILLTVPKENDPSIFETIPMVVDEDWEEAVDELFKECKGVGLVKPDSKTTFNSEASDSQFDSLPVYLRPLKHF
jgi:hypothetical protein